MPLLSNLWVGYLIMVDEKIPIYSRLQILLITLITDFQAWNDGYEQIACRDWTSRSCDINVMNHWSLCGPASACFIFAMIL